MNFTERPIVPLKDMSFTLYMETLKSEVLEFAPGKEWDNDKWNESYSQFREGIALYRKRYIDSMTSKELAIEWAREFYSSANRVSHNYWVVKKIDGWYCAETTKPPECVGVLIYVPGEDDFVTTGMWDISHVWIVLENYRTIGENDPNNPEIDMSDCKVTHWRYLPDIPKNQ